MDKFLSSRKYPKLGMGAMLVAFSVNFYFFLTSADGDRFLKWVLFYAIMMCLFLLLYIRGGEIEERFKRTGKSEK